MKFPQGAVMVPTLQVVVQGASRRQVLGNVAPLAARAQHIYDAVQNLPHVHRSMPAAMLGGRDHRSTQRPLLVRDVARVAELVPVVPGAVFSCPHRAPRESVPVSNHG